MDYETISAMWADDCKIDRNNLTVETLQGANLHQKYLAILMQCKGRQIKLTNDYALLKEVKIRYYNGELSKDELDEYSLPQYQGLKPLKSDMATKLDGDQDIIKLKLKIQYNEGLIYQLESILQSIKGRDWAIRNHLQWLQFQAGN